MPNKKICALTLAAALTLCLPFSAHAAADAAIHVIEGVNAPEGLCVDARAGLVIAGAEDNAVYAYNGVNIYPMTLEFAAGGVVTVGAPSGPSAVASDGEGTLYVADTLNHAVRTIKGGVISTLAGSGTAGFMDGTRGGAQFSAPSGIAVDARGTVYVADTRNHCIRTVDAYGYTRLYAGAPGESGFADGALLGARFFEPCGLAFGEDGALYVADSANHAVRKIMDGTVTTLAGAPGEPFRNGYTLGGHKDGMEARFNYPSDVAVYGDTVFVADTLNHCVRLIRPDGVITVLGNGVQGGVYTHKNGVRLNAPGGVAVSGDTLYVSDSRNNTVLSVPIDGALLKGRLSRADIYARIGWYADEDGMRVFANGVPVSRSAPRPYWDGADIMLPARAVSKALGLVYTWDAKARLAVVSHEGRALTFGPGQYVIKDEVAYVPLDVLAQAFDWTVEAFTDKNVLWLEMNAR